MTTEDTVERLFWGCGHCSFIGKVTGLQLQRAELDAQKPHIGEKGGNMVTQVCNPIADEAETGRFLRLSALTALYW